MAMVQELKKKEEEKNRVLESARKLFYARDDIIDLFEKGILPYKDNAFKTKEKKKTEEESEKNKLEKIKDGYKSFIKYIEDESKGSSYELFKKYFYSSVPSALVKQLYETKKKKSNYKLVSLIKSGLSDLKDEIKEMSKAEIENKKADKILKNIEEILHLEHSKESIRTTKRGRIQNINTKPNA